MPAPGPAPLLRAGRRLAPEPGWPKGFRIFACALAATGLVIAAPRPVRACDTGPANVYFAPGSAALTDRARGEIRLQAGNLELLGEGAWMRLTANSDRAGDGRANLALSRARAEAVRDALAAIGVAPSRIEIIARGEAVLPVPTPDGRAEAKNRTVEIAAFAAEQRRSEQPVPGCGGL